MNRLLIIFLFAIVFLNRVNGQTAIAAVIFLHKLSPGGPCVPGFGIMAAFIAFWIIIALMARSFYLAIGGNKKHYIVGIIHTLVLVTCMVMIVNR
ncbi:hypothetical protein [Niastella populi]|uniref:Uncharacterized protein n=1 Tax=Niastella populi TaxID=550983 RepID=A0A1V9FV37_9BACT|nr:hypothetical protein [Niastella populi]OQP62229.1 hypothetical protein A4R26_18305 [Niastella populi]